MPGPLIKLGDRTSHGGTVLAASPPGIGIARIGDQVSCPIHGKGAIISGDMSMIVDGKPVARHGDKTACGAILIASQPDTAPLL